MVRLALANGGHLPRNASASGGRDAAAVVGVGDPADHPDAIRSVLARHALRPPANGAERKGRQASIVVPEAAPDLLRRVSAGEAGVVGTEDFLRVARGEGHGKSPACVRGATNRDALLCGVNG